jgi:hypothetical protein
MPGVCLPVAQAWLPAAAEIWQIQPLAGFGIGGMDQDAAKGGIRRRQMNETKKGEAGRRECPASHNNPGISGEGFLRVRVENIPGELKGLKQWVLWRGERRGDRVTKVPYSAAGNKASPSDGNTWADFGSAVKAYKSGSWDGIGFVFAQGGGVTGIDLDHCFDADDRLEPKAAAIVGALSSYTEYSVSGSGLHIIAKASVDQGIRASTRSRLDIPVEIYSHGRYFTMTGGIYGEPASIAYAQSVVDYLREVISPAAAKGRTQCEKGRNCRYLDNGELIKAASSAENGGTFWR